VGPVTAVLAGPVQSVLTRSLFPVWITYRSTPYRVQSLPLPIADHADPVAYVPYVEA
jgi:hypothetical protein